MARATRSPNRLTALLAATATAMAIARISSSGDDQPRRRPLAAKRQALTGAARVSAIELSVDQRQHAVAASRERRIVRDEHERRLPLPVAREQQVDDLRAGRAVEIAGGLVG